MKLNNVALYYFGCALVILIFIVPIIYYCACHFTPNATLLSQIARIEYTYNLKQLAIYRLGERLARESAITYGQQLSAMEHSRRKFGLHQDRYCLYLQDQIRDAELQAEWNKEMANYHLLLANKYKMAAWFPFIALKDDPDAPKQPNRAVPQFLAVPDTGSE